MKEPKPISKTFRLTRTANEQLSDLAGYLHRKGFKRNRSKALIHAIDLVHELVIRMNGDWRIISAEDHKALLRDRIILNANLLADGENIRKAMERANKYIESHGDEINRIADDSMLNRMADDSFALDDRGTIFSDRLH